MPCEVPLGPPMQPLAVKSRRSSNSGCNMHVAYVVFNLQCLLALLISTCLLLATRIKLQWNFPTTT